MSLVDCFRAEGELFENLGGEAGQDIVLHAVTDFDRVAANFTIFYVALPANRQVQNHRNLFPAIRANEGVFHYDRSLQQALRKKVTARAFL